MKISKLYNLLPTSIEGSSDGRTAMDNETVRTVFIVGPDKKVKLVFCKSPEGVFIEMVQQLKN